MALSTTLNHEIERPISTTFRRAHIRRRQTSDGLYESSWTSITDKVKKWGQFNSQIDDVRLNRFIFSGLTIVCRNDEGDFNPESSPNSLWNGYLTRYRTLVRIQAGYEQDDRTELPTDTTQGVFILDDEIKINSIANEATLNCRSLASIFEEVRANDLGGIYTTQTASDIITRIRDHTDGSGRLVFQQFISSGAWSIATTTTNFLLSTSAAVSDKSVWDLMVMLAETEGFILNFTRSGGIVFKNRDANTTTSVIDLGGQGVSRPNVIALNWHKEAIDKFYNFIRMKYIDSDTSTSYVTAGTITSVDPSNTSWKYGARAYEFENTFLNNTTAAQSAVNAVFSMTSIMKVELEIKCLFLPHIDVLDRVTLTYLSYNLGDAVLWDTEDWASDAAIDPDDGMNWDAELGENFNFNGEAFKILSKSTNLDDFTTVLTLREV